MAWLTRGANRYYYRRKKVAGKVRSEYIGGGDLAALVAQIDASERQKALEARQAWQAIKGEQDAIDEQIDALGAVVDDYVTAIMLVTGHHQHKRQWRKQRD